MTNDNPIEVTEELIRLKKENEVMNTKIKDYENKITDYNKKIEDYVENEKKLNKLIVDNVLTKDNKINNEPKTFLEKYREVIKK